ncbi:MULTISPECIES: orotate phosphoribosyltransferase [Latilactobacillus]|uniref:Orotate phosphoribosyltransferase n=1 Tax=Latilactobacillus sakei TaxID=1599 RepID=A0AAX0VDF8_LATSK|nr:MULTISPECIES: orotate phosphoribosyltransferase [Latilactobacillus]ASN12559.1 orotate phosphoribosyltransferase [Latilactobacillus sakei]MCM1570612.1 orotate phosphoribosyltransferase [Latilactobacillus sakei]MDV8937186.1 orotate phosphoribosyltransferase [Latilactobacillus sp.]MDV8938749.1 orotate phosphoribosyltransferase [Latilactobacillus sp.]MDV8940707.1 orotate phosphoribosyltransferase [Latilactobacillus sp.]
MTTIAEQVAQALIDIKAVSLSPNQPFTWASGLKSPIYCDNRLTIGYPQVRKLIASQLAAAIKAQFPEVEVIGGTATAGIPHAAWIAAELNLPMVYIRSKPKDHGQGRQIEGPFTAGQKMVLIDDLISTGGSVLQAAQAAQKEGAEILGVFGIFSYELAAGRKNFEQAGFPLMTLSNFSALLAVEQAADNLTPEQATSLNEWRQDPQAWSDAH